MWFVCSFFFEHGNEPIEKLHSIPIPMPIPTPILASYVGYLGRGVLPQRLRVGVSTPMAGLRHFGGVANAPLWGFEGGEKAYIPWGTVEAPRFGGLRGGVGACL